MKARRLWKRVACALILAAAYVLPPGANAQEPARLTSAQLCSGLAEADGNGSSVADLVIGTARWVPGGTAVSTRTGSVSAPAHCLVEGSFGERAGLVGGPYRINFRIRLPDGWNGRYLFSGGGGSNGSVDDATGFVGPGSVPALMRGYAVIAQDSGHDNQRNNRPDLGGELAFGHDPQARQNYGFASLKPVYDIGRYLIRKFYRRDSTSNFFWGCSKGGQEGMAFAQRFPDAFDGIFAMAPGFALPKAALAQAWDTQQLAGILKARGQKPGIATLKQAFTPAQAALLSKTTLAVCDKLDGTLDGMINAFRQCTAARVLPQLRKQLCAPGGSKVCLEPAQLTALERMMVGPRNLAGMSLYADWPWDSGIGQPGWLLWKTGLENGPPSLNVVLGAGALAHVFTTPPTALDADPETMLAWQLGFSFDRDAQGIHAVAAPFTASAWSEIAMRSTDLSAFRANGGKLIVPHGMSDPVFSAYDTIEWWNAVNRNTGGQAASFVRVFPVPGMNHCAGGPSTDRFDGLAALEAWVIGKTPPDTIRAKAGPETPWPGRERPLCAYPAMAVAKGNTFVCRKARHAF